MEFKWTRSDDELPPEGVFVLGRYAGGNWRDSSDQEGCNYVVVRLVKGRKKERLEYLREWGEELVYAKGDEYGNNKRPYAWESTGAGAFFGQDIEWWTRFPWAPADPDPEAAEAYLPKKRIAKVVAKGFRPKKEKD